VVQPFILGNQRILSEVALEEAFEALAVACLVLSHLMHGVVDSIEVESLSLLGNFHLTCAGTSLGFHALLEVCLGVPNTFANQFGETAGVVSLFESITLESFSDFGIALAVGLAAHGQIHAYLGAFAFEVGLQAFPYFGITTLGNADLMFGYELQITVLFQLFELASGNFALRAAFRGFGTFVDVSANCAYKFLCHSSN